MVHKFPKEFLSVDLKIDQPMLVVHKARRPPLAIELFSFVIGSYRSYATHSKKLMF
jgi:hypothetical protein